MKKNFSKILAYYKSKEVQLRSNLSTTRKYYTKKLRVKRANDNTLVQATEKKDYTYWLSQEDIAHIARLEYDNYKGELGSNADFEVLGAMSHLSSQISSFQLKVKNLTSARLTLILNLANVHWVTLVIFYKDNNFVGYYVDSKNDPIPHVYNQFFLDRFQIQIMSLGPGFPQQSDDYNCGLWALENAADLNRMLNANESLYWVIEQFKRPRDRKYFNERRRLLTEKIQIDSAWRSHLHTSLYSSQEKPLSSSEVTSSVDNEPAPKRFKMLSREEKASILLETFVESFLNAFMKRLAAYHLIAKGEKLTAEAIKLELKTGMTGALLGIGISQSLVGSIPSLVTSLRTISGKYYFSKGKAQKITKIFSMVSSGDLGPILAEAAVDIFLSFEGQFMQITDKAGDKIAMEKLSEDAVERVINYLERHPNENKFISKELIEEGVLQGPSEKFFDPSVKEARLRISGSTLHDTRGDNVNTANLYEKVGLVVFGIDNHADRFYVDKEHPQNNRYGYRRPLSWEQVNGELKETVKEKYVEHVFPQKESIFQFNSRRHNYFLKIETSQQEAQRIFLKIENRFPEKVPDKKPIHKSAILFDLRKPVENFTGRIQLLSELHRVLVSERTIAVVPALSTLSMYSASDTSSLTSSSSLNSRVEAMSGSSMSITGLGGIGKTQLALRYAELFAKDYDYNVLWIKAETNENLAYSFSELARKLQLETQDRYNRSKSLEAIIEEVYEYFSDRKSLFIFDNVEDYRSIENYLPKSLLGNKPTLLITSRYSNWNNIATIFSLDVFTQQETTEFIKKSLDLRDNTQDERIHELNSLLQGLPLALQQAVAYIKIQKESDMHFSIHDYLELYKKKSKLLLNFDFSTYSNDLYLNTVFTTWLVTLDKIKSHATLGQDALEILNIMAYLDPENISSNNFYYLKHLGFRLRDYSTSTLLHLLKSYSMINTGRQEGKYTIHRLVQQVVRINLESNQREFEKVVEKMQRLFSHFNFQAEEENFHYLHFLLYMSEHTELRSILLSDNTEKILFDKLAYQEIKYWFYFIDLAYFKFPKEKYLTFLGDSLAYCTKSGLLLLVSETLTHIEKQWKAKLLSKENIKYIVEYVYTLKDSAYALLRLSGIPEKKQTQREAIRLIYQFKLEVFGSYELYGACPQHSLKRNVNCVLSDAEQDGIKAAKEKIIQSHFKAVAHYTNQLLIIKDILSALSLGDTDKLKNLLEMIAANVFLEKISSYSRMTGKQLAADASLIEKDLSFEEKSLLYLLSNKAVPSLAKRKVLGKALQVASPFVARGASIYFAYNLKNEIQAYQKGNNTLLPDIVSNGVIVSIDGIEAGIETLEFFDFLVEVSAFTGPAGEAIAALVWLGAEGYTAEQQVAAIEKQMHLSIDEEIIEFLRAFFDRAPSEYLEVKINNNLLIKNAVNFLKGQSKINRYVFPAFSSATAFYENSTIILDQKRNLIVNDEFDNPSEGKIFCLSGFLQCPAEKKTGINNFDNWGSVPPFGWPSSWTAFNNQTRSTISTYFCGNAIGVEYPLQQRKGTILFSLEKGNDRVISFADRPALFIVNEGEKLYKGGDKGNVFIVEASAIKGLLVGGNAIDSILLNNFQPENSDYVLLDANNFLCGGQSSTVRSVPLFCVDDKKLKLSKINQIHGRKNQQDVYYVSKGIRFIDGYGGRSKEYPDSIFITDRAYKSLKFTLRNNTLILIPSNTNVNTITYTIPAEEVGETQIQFHFSEAIQHRFFFEYSIQNIHTIDIKNNAINLNLSILDSTRSDKTFNIHIFDTHATTSNEKNITHRLGNITYLFQDIEMKLLSNKQMYAQEMVSSNKTMDEKINLFEALSEHLGMAFSIRFKNNTTLSIGREKHEIFYTEGSFETHLIGKGGENLYIVLPTNQTVFPLSDVTIYDTLKEPGNSLVEWKDTLDLRGVVEKFNEQCAEHSTFLSVVSDGNDLILNLNTHFYLSEGVCIELLSMWSLMRIKLNNTLYNNGYQKLDIFLENSIPSHIVAIDEERFFLREAPLVFGDDKKIILLTHKDIGVHAEILILRNIGNYRFFRSEAHLILTNALSMPFDYFTIICHQFYQLQEMKDKLLSASFSFFDKTIRLQAHQEEINHAANFSDVMPAEMMRSTTDSIELNSTIKNHPHELPKPTHRFKRETISENKKEHFVNQKDDSIFSIVEDYERKSSKSGSGSKHRHEKQKSKLQKNISKKISESMQKKRFMTEKNVQFPNKLKKHSNVLKHSMQNYASQITGKDLAKLKPQNPLRIPFFSKSEITHQKQNFFKDLKINKIVDGHAQKQSRLESKGLQLKQLTHKKNESGYKKPNKQNFFHNKSSYGRSNNQDFQDIVTQTTTFIQWFTRTSNLSPLSKMQIKYHNKNENDTNRKHRILGRPREEKIEVKSQGFR